MLKVLAQALGQSTAVMPGNSQASFRALEECVRAPKSEKFASILEQKTRSRKTSGSDTIIDIVQIWGP